MIDIYTEKKNCEDWIIQNDLYFNLITCNEEMTKRDINLIKQADDAALTPDKHIQTKFGLGTIRNLSSGCKTLLNIIKHPDKVVCVEECGPNVLYLRWIILRYICQDQVLFMFRIIQKSGLMVMRL